MQPRVTVVNCFDVDRMAQHARVLQPFRHNQTRLQVRGPQHDGRRYEGGGERYHELAATLSHLYAVHLAKVSA